MPTPKTLTEEPRFTAARAVRREAVIRALDAAGLDGANLRFPSCCGEPCLGVLHDTPGELLTFVAALAQEVPNVAWIGEPRQERLGLGTLTYWPGVQLGRR